MTAALLLCQRIMMRKPPFGRSHSGQSMAEYAIVVPVLLLMTLGTIEFSAIIFDYSTITNAAREGARAAIIPYGDPAQREAAALEAVLSHAPNLDLTAENMEFTWDAEESTVQVEVSYEAHLLTGALVQALGGRAVIPLHTSAIMRSE